MTTKEREELAKRINSTPKTLYNWEETRPELIKLIELGLQKEKELKENSNDDNLNAKVIDLEERLQKIETITNSNFSDYIKSLEKEVKENS